MNADDTQRQLALFPADRTPPDSEVDALQVRLSELRLSRPRQWGACWSADHLWRALHLDEFRGEQLELARDDSRGEKIPRILGIYRLNLPGSKSRWHRLWIETTALPDVFEVDARSDYGDTLYHCHDLLLEH